MTAHPRSRLPIGIVVMVLVIGTVVARRLGYNIGGHVVVRCRQGHLYTTLWIPGIKLKGLDFGLARWQYCPVGQHWSLVTPVRESDLTEEQRALAHAHHDLPIP
jgi:hypothetical protein